MTLAPLLAAPAIIRWHAAVALVAFLLGVVQLARRKGGAAHRRLGWVWVGLMAMVALSSFWISRDRFAFGPFSPIHALSVLTLATLPFAIGRARQGRIAAHRAAMLALFVGALVVAGLFTLAPGRIIGRSLFGG